MKSGIKGDSEILEALNEFLNGFTKTYTNNIEAVICHLHIIIHDFKVSEAMGLCKLRRLKTTVSGTSWY